MEELEKERQKHKHERIARIVEEGSKSEYWGILRGEIQKHIDQYQNFLDRTNMKRLTPAELDERNEMVFQLKFMKWFMNINEKIIKDQENFFKNVTETVTSFYKRAENYVKS